MTPLIDDDDAYEEAMLAIAKLRTDANSSPHGAIGDRPRGITAAPSRPASVHEGLLHSSGGTSSPLSLVDTFLGPTSVAPLVRDLPTPPAVGVEEEDPAFKNDLAHVLVWFTDDLSPGQRLSAVYTLARHLSPIQQELLLKCLREEDEGKSEDVDKVQIIGKGDGKTSPWLTERSSHHHHHHHQHPHHHHASHQHQWHIPEPQRSPPGLLPWSSNPVQIGNRASLASMPSVTCPPGSLSQRASPSSLSSSSSISISASAPSLATKVPAAAVAEEMLPANAELFHTDLSNWLRLHRLHKYESTLAGLDRAHLLALDETALEALGVAALGARRKFTRLFGAIRQAST